MTKRSLPSRMPLILVITDDDERLLFLAYMHLTNSGCYLSSCKVTRSVDAFVSQRT